MKNYCNTHQITPKINVRFLKYAILKMSNTFSFFKGACVSSFAKESIIMLLKRICNVKKNPAVSNAADLSKQILRYLPPVHSGYSQELFLGLLLPALSQ